MNILRRHHVPSDATSGGMGGRFSGKGARVSSLIGRPAGALPPFRGERCFPGQEGIDCAS